MNNMILATALVCSSATVAMAGGYVAPVIEAEPVVVAPAAAGWSGFYGGIQLGSAELSMEAIEDTRRHHGLHVGHLRDHGRLVAGAELSYDKLDDYDAIEIGREGAEGDVIRAKLLAGYDAGRFLPYAAVSYARVTLEGGSESWNDNGFGLGLGAKFAATPRLMLGVEWMTNAFEYDCPQLENSFDLDLSTISISASYRF
ncbi:MAG TPA: porin family protein [Paracoccus solventivorans]|uniref:outer membrane protein n=1 Tax=Paracoccus solventivorans TaxID=53463 RepID=UPI002B7DD7EC|nr:porin family protein [Paracoccus solventivorans]HMM08566.1 porin family protein [Paracoccus solventivorans]